MVPGMHVVRGFLGDGMIGGDKGDGVARDDSCCFFRWLAAQHHSYNQAAVIFKCMKF